MLTGQSTSFSSWWGVRMEEGRIGWGFDFPSSHFPNPNPNPNPKLSPMWPVGCPLAGSYRVRVGE